jgi:hypothetical protein
MMILATAVPVALPASLAAQDTAERAAVQRVLVAFANNVHTGRLAENEALFTPTGVHILTGDEALHSWAEYRDQQLAPELARYTGVRYAHTGVETSVRGGVAWAAFRWQMSGAGDGPAPVLGRATAVLEKIGEGWLIAHLHFSR